MSTLTFRRATRDDIPAIVAMLADDPLGSTRESPDNLAPYEAAFDVIDADPHQYLAICERECEIVGTMQISYIAGLSHKGMMRMQVEGVRIHRDARSGGVGTQMLEWAIDEARARGCGLIQLTTNTTRHDAHRFYERLGFEATHIGFKLVL